MHTKEYRIVVHPNFFDRSKRDRKTRIRDICIHNFPF
jgi:hypothetical protein